MSRKSRLLQNYQDVEEDGEPVPGPSGSGPSDYVEGPCSGSIEPGSSGRSVGSFLSQVPSYFFYINISISKKYFFFDND